EMCSPFNLYFYKLGFFSESISLNVNIRLRNTRQIQHLSFSPVKIGAFVIGYVQDLCYLPAIP
ncbi:hypothetical protein V7157_26875, partial [Neobacillus drentensis]|uniref:hypothetical protein n=1 Tax=Neobacillus drentensis TaxID=220684 RepID=UPI003001FA0E